MDLESLRIFKAVAAELSITQASARLGRAPSNVTTRIQQLEADLGVELFVRTGKRMALSMAGEHFLDYAQRMLALEEEARQVVTGGRHGGVLHLGSMESTAASRLPDLLASYHAHFPATRLEVDTGPSRQLLEQVRNGRLDCAFVALAPPLDEAQALADLGLSARQVWQEELVMLLPAGHAPVRTAQHIRIRSLAAFKQGCAYRAMAEEWLGMAGSAEWSVQEVGSYHGMVACVAAGACVALLPRSVLELTRMPPDLTCLSIRHAHTWLAWRTGYDTPAFRNLLEQLEGIPA